ncbi:MAG: ABC transporter permease [Phycisphaerae bacterium]|nr:ABC transporter permease [Phycisphaerae bacterium]
MKSGSGGAPLPEFMRVEQACALRTGLFWSLYGVWYRHVKVYCRTLIANAMPPVLEPLFFFTAVAVGLSTYMRDGLFDGLPYTAFVASGILASSSMFTGVFETTYAAFVRLTWQKTYDAMLSTHLRVHEVFTGEFLFCGTKGAVFSAVVMLVTMLFGVKITPWCVLVPVVGFATAYLFGAIGLIVTSYVKMINNFTFFTTGVITPLFFFSGTFFPVFSGTLGPPTSVRGVVDLLWFVLPLSHSVELSRALYKAQADWMTLAHVGMLLLYVVVAHWLALRRIRTRVLG